MPQFIIAVMGVTGSGKTSFIRGITGKADDNVGASLRSGMYPPPGLPFVIATAVMVI